MLVGEWGEARSRAAQLTIHAFPIQNPPKAILYCAAARCQHQCPVRPRVRSTASGIRAFLRNGCCRHSSKEEKDRDWGTEDWSRAFEGGYRATARMRVVCKIGEWGFICVFLSSGMSKTLLTLITACYVLPFQHLYMYYISSML